jgi:integrase
VYFNGKPLDKVNSITRILNKIFGKAVASSMLRHSYLTHKNGPALESMKETAKAMGHSVPTAMTYVKTNAPALEISEL